MVNKRGQAGSGISWFVATIFIFFLLILFIMMVFGNIVKDKGIRAGVRDEDSAFFQKSSQQRGLFVLMEDEGHNKLAYDLFRYFIEKIDPELRNDNGVWREIIKGTRQTSAGYGSGPQHISTYQQSQTVNVMASERRSNDFYYREIELRNVISQIYNKRVGDCSTVFVADENLKMILSNNVQIPAVHTYFARGQFPAISVDYSSAKRYYDSQYSFIFPEKSFVLIKYFNGGC